MALEISPGGPPPPPSPHGAGILPTQRMWLDPIRPLGWVAKESRVGWAFERTTVPAPLRSSPCACDLTGQRTTPGLRLAPRGQARGLSQ